LNKAKTITNLYSKNINRDIVKVLSLTEAEHIMLYSIIKDAVEYEAVKISYF